MKEEYCFSWRLLLLPSPPCWSLLSMILNLTNQTSPSIPRSVLSPSLSGSFTQQGPLHFLLSSHCPCVLTHSHTWNDQTDVILTSFDQPFHLSFVFPLLSLSLSSSLFLSAFCVDTHQHKENDRLRLRRRRR